MSASAIIMMIIFMLVIWLGLILSIIALVKNPDNTSGLLKDFPNTTDSDLLQG